MEKNEFIGGEKAVLRLLLNIPERKLIRQE